MSIDDADASQSEEERNAKKSRHSGYGTFFGKPAARMMYDLAVHANKTSPDLLWYVAPASNLNVQKVVHCWCDFTLHSRPHE